MKKIKVLQVSKLTHFLRYQFKFLVPSYLTSKINPYVKISYL